MLGFVLFISSRTPGSALPSLFAVADIGQKIAQALSTGGELLFLADAGALKIRHKLVQAILAKHLACPHELYGLERAVAIVGCPDISTPAALAFAGGDDDLLHERLRLPLPHVEQLVLGLPERLAVFLGESFSDFVDDAKEHGLESSGDRGKEDAEHQDYGHRYPKGRKETRHISS